MTPGPVRMSVSSALVGTLAVTTVACLAASFPASSGVASDTTGEPPLRSVFTLAAVLGVALVALAGSAFFSGCETGLYCVNRLRVELADQRGDVRYARLVRLLKDERSTLTVALVGTNLMNYLATLAVTYLLATHLQLTGRTTEVYVVAVLTPIVFVFGEVVPKNVFQIQADRLMPRSSTLLAAASLVCRYTGLVWFLALAAGTVGRLFSRGVAEASAIEPRRRIAVLLREALADEQHGEEQSDLADRVLQLAETPLHAVMLPRNQVVTISADADQREFRSVARRMEHARLPVHRGHPLHVVGTVKVEELLLRTDWTTVGQLLRPMVAVGPHDTVAIAINRLQQDRQPLAVVTDRGGRMLGIVTFNDLLWEIVGELGEPNVTGAAGRAS
jgi:CBS domain containing-hemolysin-like protein